MSQRSTVDAAPEREGCQMEDRFDRFSDHARRVLTYAQDEARRFNHSYIGTEHLLLGLVRLEDGTAIEVLRNLGVEVPKVRTAVEFIIGRGDLPVAGTVGLTSRAKRVIELTVDESRRMGHHGIGTGHLLLGLIREGEGIAARVLESQGVTLDNVRREVAWVLSESSSVEPDEGPPGDAGYQVLSSSVRVGRGGLMGAGLTSLPPEDRERLERLRAAAELRPALASSALERLVRGGAALTVHGVTVELVVLEIRGSGARGLLEWRAEMPWEPTGRLSVLMADIAVRDDRGTVYEVESDPWRGAANGGGAAEWFCKPPPPEGAGELVVSITRLVSWWLPGRGAPTDAPPETSIEGPWEFRVPL